MNGYRCSLDNEADALTSKRREGGGRKEGRTDKQRRMTGKERRFFSFLGKEGGRKKHQGLWRLTFLHSSVQLLRTGRSS